MAPRSRVTGFGFKPPRVAVVKSRGGERRWKRHSWKCQVGIRKMNESEQPMTCRKAIQQTSKPDSVVDPGQVQTIPVYGLSGVRCRGCMSLIQALLRNVGTYRFDTKGREAELLSGFASTNVNRRGGAIRSSDETAVTAVERRDCVIQPRLVVNQ